MPETWKYLGSKLGKYGWVAILTDPHSVGRNAWNENSLKTAISNRGEHSDFDGALPVLREALIDLTGPRRKQVKDA